MKTSYFATAIIISLGSAASAQSALQGGEISMGIQMPLAYGEVLGYDLGGKVEFALGSIGIQADIGLNTTNLPFLSSTTTSAGLGAYYTFAGGSKAGLFTSYESENPSTFVREAYILGGEAMFDLGQLDIEISAGTVFYPYGRDNDVTASLDVYYQISDQFEVSAGMFVYADDWNMIGYFATTTVGASYSLANLPVSFNLQYQSARVDSSSAGEGMVIVSVSYRFGDSNGRLFQRRAIDFGAIVSSLPPA